MAIVPTTPERNADLARIHSEARRQGMSEFARRALQYAVTGQESCLLMSGAERKAVIAELEKQAAPKYADDDYSDEACRELLGF